MQPFYLYGRLIAVLEQGGQAHGQIPWLELYYPRGFLPWVGLRDPLRKHLQSVLPFLERRRRAERYLAQLNALAQRPAKLRRASTGPGKLRQLVHPIPVPRPQPQARTSPQIHAQGGAALRPGLPGGTPDPPAPAPTAAKRRGPLSVLLGLPPGPAAHLEHRR